MLKTFVKGLAFGTGFTMAMIIVMMIYSRFFIPFYVGEPEFTFDDLQGNSEPRVIDRAPEIVDDTPAFRGTAGLYPNEYAYGRAAVLAEGSAKIIGSVDANGGPVQGLRLRLILNKTIDSQWTVSNDEGSYVLNVPPGDYQVTGFELDRNTANKVLAGFVDGPDTDGPFGEVIAVSEENPGAGLRFSYVNPVVKLIHRESFSLDDQIMLRWEPYPNAVEYKIQVEGRDKNNSPRRFDSLFEWTQLPQTAETYFDLTPLVESLKSDYYYSYEVTALGSDGMWLSKSGRQYGDYDFYVE